MLAIATFGIPILGSILTLLADRVNGLLRNILAVLTVAATLACALLLIPISTEAKTIMLGPSTIPGFGFNFIVDGLGVYVAITSALIGLLIVVYSVGYMRDYEHLGEYYFLVVLFLGAMMGLVLSANLLLIYIFWEITAICSWRLIGFFRDPAHLRNADTALLMTVFGSFFMLVGMEMVWHETGTLTVAAIRGHTVSDLAMFFMFIGILAKSAQVPLQIWLPAAGVAPSPVTALLHAAVLVVIGVFAFARIFIGAFNLPANWQTYTSIVATLTILIAGGAALVENNAKRILAYSTLGQLAYVYLGFASMTAIGIVGGLVFLLAHSLAKAGLFLCVGIIEHKTHTKDIRDLGGMINNYAGYRHCVYSVFADHYRFPAFGWFCWQDDDHHGRVAGRQGYLCGVGGVGRVAQHGLHAAPVQRCFPRSKHTLEGHSRGHARHGADRGRICRALDFSWPGCHAVARCRPGAGQTNDRVTI